MGRYGWTAQESEELFIQTWSSDLWQGRTIKLHVPAKRHVEVDFVQRRSLANIERVSVANPSPGPSPR
jgi:hypothetical protein